MSDFEKAPVADLRDGDWVIIKGRLSRVAVVDGSVITTDRGYVGDTRLRGTQSLSRVTDADARSEADIRDLAWTIHRNLRSGPVRHLGAAQVAEEVGVTRSTITTSLRRHGLTSARPFPQPAVYIGDTPGWERGQVADIRAWFGQPAKGRPRKTAAAKLVEGVTAAVEQLEEGQRAEDRRRQAE